ncbi:unnamed protein product [Arctia plantaginis]|uniref:Neurotransmitter-gated ion-channel ligand-binding domain-containing protein n=1 Tax=Arctia plantaginis TaxID=874455 RepID=A0A8S1BCS5_ARCPL|nr:unnamed protein product [Arctia plantaginis]
MSVYGWSFELDSCNVYFENGPYAIEFRVYGLFGAFNSSVSEQGPHEKRLLNALLASYNTLERPVANESEPLEVRFGLTLQQIIDVVSQNLFLRRCVEDG